MKAWRSFAVVALFLFGIVATLPFATPQVVEASQANGDGCPGTLIRGGSGGGVPSDESKCYAQVTSPTGGGSTWNASNVTPDASVPPPSQKDQAKDVESCPAGSFVGSANNPLGGTDPRTCYIKDSPTSGPREVAHLTIAGAAAEKAKVDAAAAANAANQDCPNGKNADGSCVENADQDAIGDCGGGAMNWIICPVIQLAKAGAEKIDSFIMKSLEVDVTGIFETECTSDNKTTVDPNKTCTGKYYYAAWNSFRILATAILVIAGLVMVISQALGFDFLDAYTMRKVLPRLVIAIIGISLSWPLMRFVVEFFNVLGLDIRSLMYAPFSNLGGNIDPTVGIGTSIGLLAGGLVLGGIGLLSLMATALLAVLVGFVIIVVRQIAIVMLVVVAPIAIACYILPNTEKVWKLWKDNFLGLMLMFPIISAFIAAGHIFSAVSLADNSGGTATGANLVAQIVGIVAYFLPYFLLPLTFRIATGVIGTIAGFANDRSRGVFDRLKKGRQERMSDRISRAQNESLWDKNSRVGKVGNKFATWATDPLGNAAYKARGAGIPGLSKRGAKIATAIEHSQVEQSGKLFEELNKMGYNDKAFRALSGVHSGLKQSTQDKLKSAGLLGKAPTSIKQMEQMSHILSDSEDDAEKLAANAIHGSMGRLATLYQDPEMGKASIAGAGIMGLAAHGFASTGDLAEAGNTLKKQGGAGMAQSIVSQAQLMGARSRPDTKPGYGVMYDSASGQFVDGLKGSLNPDGTQSVSSRAHSVIKSLSSHDLASAKSGAFDALAPTIKGVLDAGSAENASPVAVAESKAVQDQLFSWAGQYSQASVDVKSRAIQLIEDRSKHDDKFAKAWSDYKREVDPSVRQGTSGQPEPTPPPSGGPGQG